MNTNGSSTISLINFEHVLTYQKLVQKFTPWTQDVHSTYIKRLEDVQDVF